MDAKTVFCLFVLHRLCIQALPVNEIENSSCILMTPERVKELNEIGEEFNNFINKLSDKYEDIDLTFVEIKVENHTDDEEEDKETTLEISVKDCNNDKDGHDEKDFENSDEPNNSTTEDIDVGELTESNNKDFTGVEENIYIKSQNERSQTTNLNKTYKSNVLEENANESEDETIIQSKTNVLDSNLTQLSEISNNNEKSDALFEDNIFKDGDIQKHNRLTENDHNLLARNEIKNFDKVMDKHNLKDIGKSKIIIYAPNIDNTKIEIGGEYANNAIRSALRILALKQLTKFLMNPTELYQNPIDNFEFSNQANNNFDSNVDVTVKDNLDSAQPFEGNAKKENNEAKNLEFEENFEDPLVFWL